MESTLATGRVADHRHGLSPWVKKVQWLHWCCARVLLPTHTTSRALSLWLVTVMTGSPLMYCAASLLKRYLGGILPFYVW